MWTIMASSTGQFLMVLLLIVSPKYAEVFKVGGVGRAACASLLCFPPPHRFSRRLGSLVEDQAVTLRVNVYSCRLVVYKEQTSAKKYVNLK